MITNHTFECKGCFKFNTKDDMQFIYINTEITGTFKDVSETFETYLYDMFQPMKDCFDLAEPKTENAVYEIISVKEVYK